MKRDQPTTPDEWLDEIRLAVADARKTKPFGLLVGQPITDANLFHLAPLVCMKFRGLDFRNEDLRKKVIEGALANYVANSDPDRIDHGLEQKPLLAFGSAFPADRTACAQGVPQHKTMLAGKSDGVIATPQNQVVCLGDNDQFVSPRQFEDEN